MTLFAADTTRCVYASLYLVESVACPYLWTDVGGLRIPDRHVVEVPGDSSLVVSIFQPHLGDSRYVIRTGH